MATIPNGSLLTLLDSLASGKLIFDNGVGTSSSAANTTQKAANNDLATLQVIADAQVQAELVPAFKFRADTLTATALYQALGAYNLFLALDRHLGGFDTYLATNDMRASVHLREMGFPLSPGQVMPPSVDPMATFAVTGSGAGAYAHVADVDTTQYGKAWLQVVTTATIGAQAINATVWGLQIDGVTPVSKTVTIAQNSSSGTTVNVGTLGVSADHYAAVTNVSITGGTAGDAFKVISRVERTITATA